MEVFYLYNNVNKRIIGFYNLNGFIHKINNIAKENDDVDFSLLHKGECEDYVREYCENIDLHIVPIDRNDVETVIEDLNFITKDELHYLDDLVNYVVSNYNETTKDSDETWNIIIEDLIYRYTSENPDQYKQETKLKLSDGFKSFDGISDKVLITELKNRGYYTDLLYNKHDVENILNEDFDGKKLSEENKLSILNSIITDGFTQELNETISRMIEDDYKDELYE